MKTVVLDTNILIDNVHCFAPWVNDLLKLPQEYRLVVPTICVAEYFTAEEIETVNGFEKSKSYLAVFEIIELTFGIAEILGQILRRKTYPPGANTADLIIASTTIYLNGELATKNKKDFTKIPHLRFFDPEKL